MKLKDRVKARLENWLGIVKLEGRLILTEGKLRNTRDEVDVLRRELVEKRSLLADINLHSNSMIIVASRVNKNHDTVKVFNVHFDDYKELEVFLARLKDREVAWKHKFMDAEPAFKNIRKDLMI